ncbi:MAG: hypothetical protein WC410_00415 [Candidatus Paceibacterota bacterium]|nr:hypothetical protein [Candidatus Paceibacterota bacterium]
MGSGKERKKAGRNPNTSGHEDGCRARTAGQKSGFRAKNKPQ